MGDNKPPLFQSMRRGDMSHSSLYRSASDDQLDQQENIVVESLQLLVAGPLLVNYVNNLLVHASKRDFPLLHPANYIFQHIKDPTSFRGVLAQITNSIYSSLLATHTAMPRLELNAQQLSNHIKTVFKLFASKSPMLIELILPKTLEAIERIANESVAHTRALLNKQLYVPNLLHEVLEISTYTQSILMGNTLKKRSDITETTKSKTLLSSYDLTTFTNKMNTRSIDGKNKQEILGILPDSVFEMSRTQEQWSKLIRFFENLDIQANILQQIIKQFLKIVEDIKANNLRVHQLTDKELFLHLLAETNLEIEESADLFHIISKTYFDISSEYMINQISSKNTLLLLQTDADRASYLNSLSLNTTSASTRVLQLAQERSQEMTVRLNHHREEYDHLLDKWAEENLETTIG